MCAPSPPPHTTAAPSGGVHSAARLAQPRPCTRAILPSCVLRGVVCLGSSDFKSSVGKKKAAAAWRRVAALGDPFCVIFRAFGRGAPPRAPWSRRARVPTSVDVVAASGTRLSARSHRLGPPTAPNRRRRRRPAARARTSRVAARWMACRIRKPVPRRRAGAKDRMCDERQSAFVARTAS